MKTCKECKYRVEEENGQSYEDGLADAWKAAGKIGCDIEDGGIPLEDLTNAFGISNPSRILAGNTPQQAIAKLREWEESKEIKRGDEVKSAYIGDGYFGEKGIVLQAGTSEDGAIVLWCDEKIKNASENNLTKTGRNFADKLDALLSEIGGEHG